MVHPRCARAADPHDARFHLKEFFEAATCGFAPLTGLHDTARGDFGQAPHPGVGPDHCGLTVAAEVRAAVDIVAPAPCRQAVACVIGQGNHLFRRPQGQHRPDRAEHFPAGDGHVGGGAAKRARLTELPPRARHRPIAAARADPGPGTHGRGGRCHPGRLDNAGASGRQCEGKLLAGGPGRNGPWRDDRHQADGFFQNHARYVGTGCVMPVTGAGPRKRRGTAPQICRAGAFAAHLQNGLAALRHLDRCRGRGIRLDRIGDLVQRRRTGLAGKTAPVTVIKGRAGRLDCGFGPGG